MDTAGTTRDRQYGKAEWCGREFSVIDTLIGMLFALVIGLFVFLVYKKTFSGVMYSTGFAMALIGLSLVTTLVIMAVTSNVVLSLGMVGALSIVR